METTKLQKKITSKQIESRRHSDSIQQGHSNQKCNFGRHNKEDEDDDTDNSDVEYPHLSHTVSKMQQWLVSLSHATSSPCKTCS